MECILISEFISLGQIIIIDSDADPSFPHLSILSIEFIFKQNNLYYLYYKDQFKLLVSNIVSNSNNRIEQNVSTLDWPDAGDLYKMSNQTKIWFGYNFDFALSTNQVIGCIIPFDVNKKQIKLEMKGDHFNINCSRVGTIENTYYYGIYESNKSIYFDNILDCNTSISEMNSAKHCHPDLSYNSDLLRSYERIDDYRRSIVVKLVWIPKQSTTQCLLEILTREFSLIEIFLNSKSQIIFAAKLDYSTKWSEYILYEISSEEIHILKIELTYKESIFKSTFFLMKAFKKIVEASKIVSSEDLPKTKHAFCQTTMSLSSESKYAKSKTKVYCWIIFVIMMISVSCNISICTRLIIRKIKKRKENIQRSALNIYEEPMRMNDLADLEHAVNEE